MEFSMQSSFSWVFKFRSGKSKLPKCSYVNSNNTVPKLFLVHFSQRKFWPSAEQFPTTMKCSSHLHINLNGIQTFEYICSCRFGLLSVFSIRCALTKAINVWMLYVACIEWNKEETNAAHLLCYFIGMMCWSHHCRAAKPIQLECCHKFIDCR